ncbi:MAG: beta-galactosidase [Anaerolineae bacterium]|nr:beta-galactosidase [Anaerolineae bacterium]
MTSPIRLQSLRRFLGKRGFWARVLAVALAVLAWRGVDRPPAPLVAPGPPQTVVTRNPKLGLHTRLTDEVEPWKIKRSLQMVREMGAPWIVEYFPWAYYEPDKGRFDWTHADLVVDHAVAQGLTVIARLGFVPVWARPEETTFTYLDENGYDDFADYAAAFVEHFRGRVSYVIIWNEPNLASEWGNRPPDPQAYTALLKVAYARIKAAAPEVTVLAPALAPTLAPPGDPWAMEDLAFLQAMYDAGAAPYFDALAAHTYGWGFPADDPPAPDKVNFRRVELVRALMEANGDGGKDVFITETGWNDHPRWTKAVKPTQRIAYSVEAARIALEDWPWCRALVFWVLRFPRPQLTYQDAFTFVTSDFVPKPVYLAIQEAYAGR